MHLKVFPLLSGALGRLGGLECVLVDGFEGELAEDVFNLPCLDVLLLDLRPRLTDVSGAEGSLVIGEVNQRDLGVLITLEGSAVGIENDALGLGR